MLYFNTILCNNRFIRQWNILLPYPPCEISPVRSQVLTKVQFFFTSSTTFLQKRFLCVKLQYLVSTYLQLDCLYLKKQIYSETFCYPTPM